MRNYFSGAQTFNKKQYLLLYTIDTREKGVQQTMAEDPWSMSLETLSVVMIGVVGSSDFVGASSVV